MSKVLFIGLLLASIVSASFSQAQEREVRNGKRTIIIDINSQDRDQEVRIRRLERAVRDLQDQVWQLSSQPVRTDLYVCETRPFMETIRSDKFELEYDAKRDVSAKCERKYHAMHCGSSTCQKIR